MSNKGHSISSSGGGGGGGGGAGIGNRPLLISSPTTSSSPFPSSLYRTAGGAVQEAATFDQHRSFSSSFQMDNGISSSPMCGPAFITKVLNNHQKKQPFDNGASSAASRRTLFFRRSHTHNHHMAYYDDIISLEQEPDTESESSASMERNSATSKEGAAIHTNAATAKAAKQEFDPQSPSSHIKDASSTPNMLQFQPSSSSSSSSSLSNPPPSLSAPALDNHNGKNQRDENKNRVVAVQPNATSLESGLKSSNSNNVDHGAKRGASTTPPSPQPNYTFLYHNRSNNFAGPLPTVTEEKSFDSECTNTTGTTVVRPTTSGGDDPLSIVPLNGAAAAVVAIATTPNSPTSSTTSSKSSSTATSLSLAAASSTSTSAASFIATVNQNTPLLQANHKSSVTANTAALSTLASQSTAASFVDVADIPWTPKTRNSSTANINNPTQSRHNRTSASSRRNHPHSDTTSTSTNNANTALLWPSTMSRKQQHTKSRNKASRSFDKSKGNGNGNNDGGSSAVATSDDDSNVWNAMRSMILKQQEALRDVSRHATSLRDELTHALQQIKDLRRHGEEQQMTLTRLVIEKQHVEVHNAQLQQQVHRLQLLFQHHHGHDGNHDGSSTGPQRGGLDTMPHSTRAAVTKKPVQSPRTQQRQPSYDVEQDDLTQRFERLMEDHIDEDASSSPLMALYTSSSLTIDDNGRGDVEPTSLDNDNIPTTPNAANAALQSTASFVDEEDCADDNIRSDVSSSHHDTQLLRLDHSRTWEMDDNPPHQLQLLQHEQRSFDSSDIFDVDTGKAPVVLTNSNGNFGPRNSRRRDDGTRRGSHGHGHVTSDVRLNLVDCMIQSNGGAVVVAGGHQEVDAFKERLDKIQQKRWKHKQGEGTTTAAGPIVRFA